MESQFSATVSYCTKAGSIHGSQVQDAADAKSHFGCCAREMGYDSFSQAEMLQRKWKFLIFATMVLSWNGRRSMWNYLDPRRAHDDNILQRWAFTAHPRMGSWLQCPCCSMQCPRLDQTRRKFGTVRVLSVGVPPAAMFEDDGRRMTMVRVMPFRW